MIYIVERTNKAELRPEEQSEKELLGEFMEWNRVERAIKIETDTRTNKNEWASSDKNHYTPPHESEPAGVAIMEALSAK